MKVETFKTKYWDQLQNIFFQTSSKNEFKTSQEKEQFYQNYLGHYVSNYPQTIYLALEGEQVLGYLVICPDTAADLKLMASNPHLRQFASYYNDYPAHLHINLHPTSQGMGVGSRLMQYGLSRARVKGIHLITMENSRNVSFYLKNGFEILATFPDKTQILGQKLTMNPWPPIMGKK